jgi:hypothetical protein
MKKKQYRLIPHTKKPETKKDTQEKKGDALSRFFSMYEVQLPRPNDKNPTPE